MGTGGYIVPPESRICTPQVKDVAYVKICTPYLRKRSDAPEQTCESMVSELGTCGVTRGVTCAGVM